MLQITGKGTPLNSPEISSKNNKRKKGVTCWIKSVKNNEGSSEMQVPTNKTWRIKVKKKELAKISGLGRCKNKPGDSYFTVKGKPKNSDIIRSVEKHERRHDSDFKNAFEKIVGDWDKKMTKVWKNKTVFNGPD